MESIDLTGLWHFQPDPMGKVSKPDIVEETTR